MRIRVIAVGTRMPGWVDEVCAGYIRRLGSKLRVAVTEIAAGPRGPGGTGGARAREIEGRRILAALQPDEFVVALDERGRQLATRALAGWLRERMAGGRDLVFVIGGPDGLVPAVLERSQLTWSLSPLTFPHALVRVLLVEQLYRAHCVLTGHPYHRD